MNAPENIQIKIQEAEIFLLFIRENSSSAFPTGAGGMVVPGGRDIKRGALLMQLSLPGVRLKEIDRTGGNTILGTNDFQPFVTNMLTEY